MKKNARFAMTAKNPTGYVEPCAGDGKLDIVYLPKSPSPCQALGLNTSSPITFYAGSQAPAWEPLSAKL